MGQGLPLRYGLVTVRIERVGSEGIPTHMGSCGVHWSNSSRMGKREERIEPTPSDVR